MAPNYTRALLTYITVMRYLTGRSFRKKSLFLLTVSDDSVHHGREVHVSKEGVRGPLFHNKPGSKECKPRMGDFVSPSKACPQKSVSQAQLLKVPQHPRAHIQSISL